MRHKAALEDALEQLACNDWDTADIERRLLADSVVLRDEHDESLDEEQHYYVSVLVR